MRAMTRLRSLTLRGTTHMFLGSPFPPTLRRVDFTGVLNRLVQGNKPQAVGCSFHGNALAPLRGSVQWARFRYCRQLSNAHLENLATAQTLDLGWCANISTPGIRHLTALRQLDLHHCTRITNGALAALPTCLQELNIAHCTRVTDGGMVYLRRLRVLNIVGCARVGEPGLVTLSGSAGKLQKLTLDDFSRELPANALRGFTRLQTLRLRGRHHLLQGPNFWHSTQAHLEKHGVRFIKL